MTLSIELLYFLIGSISILSICWVMLKTHTIPLSGMPLLFSGVILFGMPFWQSGKFGIDKNGVRVEFERVIKKLEALDSQLMQSDKSNRLIQLQISSLNRELDRQLNNLNSVANMQIAAISMLPEIQSSNTPIALALSKLQDGATAENILDSFDNRELEEASKIIDNAVALSNLIGEQSNQQKAVPASMLPPEELILPPTEETPPR